LIRRVVSGCSLIKQVKSFKLDNNSADNNNSINRRYFPAQRWKADPGGFAALLLSRAFLCVSAKADGTGGNGSAARHAPLQEHSGLGDARAAALQNRRPAPVARRGARGGVTAGQLSRCLRGPRGPVTSGRPGTALAQPLLSAARKAMRTGQRRQGNQGRSFQVGWQSYIPLSCAIEDKAILNTSIGLQPCIPTNTLCVYGRTQGGYKPRVFSPCHPQSTMQAFFHSIDGLWRRISCVLCSAAVVTERGCRPALSHVGRSPVA
jgi:hypothetical protein